MEESGFGKFSLQNSFKMLSKQFSMNYLIKEMNKNETKGCLLSGVWLFEHHYQLND